MILYILCSRNKIMLIIIENKNNAQNESLCYIKCKNKLYKTVV